MARPLGVRGHQKRSFLVACSKANGEIFVESLDEATTMLALDIDPRVRSITPQPFTVRLDLEESFSTRSEAIRATPAPQRVVAVNGQPSLELIYTPDFVVELATPVRLVVESKSTREIENIGDALARRGRILNSLGFRYLVVPSTELDHRGLHANLSLLRDTTKYQRENDTVSMRSELHDLLSSRSGPFLLGEIRGHVHDLGIYLGLISGAIACDLRSGRLGVDTRLWLSHGDLGHLQLLALER